MIHLQTEDMVCLTVPEVVVGNPAVLWFWPQRDCGHHQNAARYLHQLFLLPGAIPSQQAPLLSFRSAPLSSATEPRFRRRMVLHRQVALIVIFSGSSPGRELRPRQVLGPTPKASSSSLGLPPFAGPSTSQGFRHLPWAEAPPPQLPLAHRAWARDRPDGPVALGRSHGGAEVTHLNATQKEARTRTRTRTGPDRTTWPGHRSTCRVWFGAVTQRRSGRFG